MYVDIDKDGEVQVNLEFSEGQQDECFTCVWIEDCPLINALYQQVVCPTASSINVQRCGLFSPTVEEESIEEEETTEKEDIITEEKKENFLLKIFKDKFFGK